MNALLTRPLRQVEALKNLVLKSGHQPILFPTLQISPLTFNTSKKYDGLIFISTNAVQFGLKTLQQVYYDGVKIFAVGAKTAQKLSDFGFKVDGYPKKNPSSEALLKISEVVKLSGKNILIFRGKGGVETLKKALLSQQNQVEYAEVYERIICKITDQHKKSLSQFLTTKNAVITATSVENLQNLLKIIKIIDPKSLPKIKKYQLIVISKRIKIAALKFGFENITITKDIDDFSLVEAISAFANILDNSQK